MICIKLPQQIKENIRSNNGPDLGGNAQELIDTTPHNLHLVTRLGKKLHLEEVPVDKLRLKKETLRIMERNEIIASEISRHDKDGLFITGMHHLHGLIQNPCTKVDPKQFHIVPFNLVPLISTMEKTTIPTEKFAYSDKRVIQIANCTFPTPQEPIAQPPSKYAH